MHTLLTERYAVVKVTLRWSKSCMLVYAVYPKERKDVGTYLCNPLPSKASHTSGKKYSV